MMGIGSHSLRTCLVLFTFAILVAGCTKVGPDYVRPETAVSQTWLEAGDKRVKTEPAEYRNWWKAFNDPTLDRLIETAYRENLNLRMAGVRVLAARAQLGIATGQLYPQTQQATGSVPKGARSAPGPRSRVQPHSSSSFGGLSLAESQIGLTASWEIDFWGKFRRAIESADAGLMASIANYDSTLVSLTANVANFYITIRTVERRLNIAHRNVETQRESLEIAQARFEGGTTSQRDVDQAKTILTGTEATIPPLKIQLRQAKDALCVLLGLPPNLLTEQLQGKGGDPGAAAPRWWWASRWTCCAGGRISGPRNTMPWPNAPKSACPRPSSSRPLS